MLKSRLVTICDPNCPNIRVIVEETGILFCGADIAKALGFRDPNSAIAYHCRNVTKRTIQHPQSAVRTIEMCFLRSEDVIRLAAASKRKDAMHFAKWLTEYMSNIIKQVVLHRIRIVSGEKKICSLGRKVFSVRPEASAIPFSVSGEDLYDSVVMASMDISTVSSKLQIFELDLCRILQECGLLCMSAAGKMLPNPVFMGLGFFVVANKMDPSTGKFTPYTVVTPKGVAFLGKLIEEIWNQEGV